MPVRFLTPNLIDDATLSASSEHASYPVENIQDVRLPKKWQTDQDDIILLDNCETADYAEAYAAGGESVNSSTYSEGAGSLNLPKSGTGTTTAAWIKTFGATQDATDYRLQVDVRLKDATALNKLDPNTGNAIKLIYGNSISNYFLGSFDRSLLTAGQFVTLEFDIQAGTEVGSVDITTMDYYALLYNTINASDTLSSDDFIMDNVRLIRIYEWVKVDLGSAQSVTAAVIAGHTLLSTDSEIELYYSDDDSTYALAGTFAYDSKAMALFITSASHRYWKYRFKKAATDADRQIGRLFIGTYVQPTRGIRLDWKREYVDPSNVKRAFTGTQYADVMAQYWSVAFSLDYEPSSGIDTLRSALKDLGIHGELFISLDPVNNPSGDYTLYGRFDKAWNESEPLNSFGSVSFDFNEDV